MHLQGLQGRATLVSKDTMTRLHTPPVGGAYACGWLEESAYGGRTSWHDGSAGSFVAFMLLDPQRSLAFAGVTNGAPPLTDNNEVFLELLGWVQETLWGPGAAAESVSRGPYQPAGAAAVSRRRGLR
jgi:CubicO group peptidase (beta-lactamase class C family)